MHGIGRFAMEVGRRLTGFERISLSGTPLDPIDSLRLTRYLRSVKPEIYLSPGYNSPLGTPCPFVIAVHDLNHIAINGNSSAAKRAYYRFVLKPALHRARAVLTVSEFARSAICHWAGIDSSRVSNVGNGISAAFKPAPTATTAAASRPRYFLYVGNHKPHKNFDRLLRAFAASGIASDFELVSTGTPNDALRLLIMNLRLTDRVRFVGEVSDEALADLYRGAMALALVSLYEGFGLPLVEAMACGTPVLTSNLASMPEVVGGAGLEVDPLDVDAIAVALVRMASDSELRQRLSVRGIARAKLYSWDSTARLVNQAVSSCA